MSDLWESPEPAVGCGRKACSRKVGRPPSAFSLKYPYDAAGAACLSELPPEEPEPEESDFDAPESDDEPVLEDEPLDDDESLLDDESEDPFVDPDPLLFDDVVLEEPAVSEPDRESVR